MIYFGTNAKSREPLKLAGLACPNCGHQSLYTTLYHKYLHIWFIPFFPLGKIAEVKCTACYRMWEEPEMNGFMAGSVEEVKRETSPPNYLFSGLYLAGIVVVAVMYSGWRNDKDTAQYITDPHRQDLYVVESERDEEYPNIILKVMNVNGDSVEMMEGRYGYSTPGNAARAVSNGALQEPGYFVKRGAFSRNKLLELYDLKKIVRIIREDEGIEE